MDPNQRLVTSVVAASGAILTYDFFCTLDLEVNHVWSRPFSTSTLIFVLNRYSPFIDTFLSLSLKLTVNSPERCVAGFKVVTWFIAFGIILAEIIMMLRTYAIWGCRRSVMIGFIVLGLVTFVPAIAITQIELSSLIYIQKPYLGCYLSHASPIIIVAYILLVLCETVIAIMMAIKAFQHLPHSHSRWVDSLYKNGLLYYACLFAISLGNVLVPVVNSHLANMLATPQRVLHSILCNRLLFLILSNKSSSASPPGFTSALPDEEISTHLVFAHSEPPPNRRERFSPSYALSTLSEGSTLAREDEPYELH